ncbi:hypothetical protein B484DRAFT_452392 [Ochromonadaceae sp. CCMP2298]|nr:hypothetical protein B484DRAFT_452392 [Ochromonadaceae sp. CCMP2298]
MATGNSFSNCFATAAGVGGAWSFSAFLSCLGTEAAVACFFIAFTAFGGAATLASPPAWRQGLQLPEP